MFRKIFAWMNRYERHLSAAAMVAGAVVDQFFFGPVDVPTTQAVFLTYIAICVVSLAALHHIETLADHGHRRPRWRVILPTATQFALGGFWSGFIVFYGRSAALAVSWPFLLALAVILVLNEVLKKYHGRLIFTNVLFFFALFSYVIFALPVFTGTLGTPTFLASGAIALGGFAVFQAFLFAMGRTRYKAAFRGIALGTVLVYFFINLCYFTNILPPLPLSMKDVGVYHSVTHVGNAYIATAEVEPWPVRLGIEPATLHVLPGERLYAYSAIFTPIKLSTTVTHRWELYDPISKKWVTRLQVPYAISGGRDGGYRGYSIDANIAPGKWRVDIETVDHRLIGRIDFTVVSVSTAVATVSETL